MLAVALLPACIAMGATFPLMLAFIRSAGLGDETRFSFLYLGERAWRLAGCRVDATGAGRELRIRRHPALRRGCQHDDRRHQRVAWPADSRTAGSARNMLPERASTSPSAREEESATQALSILFITGFSSMGMEVVWTRVFTPVLGTYVYSFAGLLVVYLWATWLGSWLYRVHVARHAIVSTAKLIVLLALTSFLPIVANDARFGWHRVAIALASILPFCLVLGYLTPGLIDRYSHDDPRRAGKAYAVNVIGCVLGPLVAGYLLLPALGARIGLVVLALPFAILLAGFWKSPALARRLAGRGGRRNSGAAGAVDAGRRQL